MGMKAVVCRVVPPVVWVEMGKEGIGKRKNDVRGGGTKINTRRTTNLTRRVGKDGLG